MVLISILVAFIIVQGSPLIQSQILYNLSSIVPLYYCSDLGSLIWKTPRLWKMKHTSFTVCSLEVFRHMKATNDYKALFP